jgi:hypothetical protein
VRAHPYDARVARCPACDYDLSSLPGVPGAAGEPFGARVRCPECGHGFPAGTLLLSGSAFVATLQPATRRARVRAVLVSFAPALWLVFQGIEGLIDLSTGRGTWWANLLRISLLAIVGVLVVRAVRLWRRTEGGKGAPIAGRDMAWEVRPGSLEMFTRGDESKVSAVKRFPADRLRNVVAHAAPEVPLAPGERPNNVVLLETYFWVIDRDGRRSDIESTSIYVDAGGERAELPSGRRSASLAAGHALAARVAETLRATGGTEAVAGMPAADVDLPPPAGCEATNTRAITVTGAPRVIKQLQRGLVGGAFAGFLAWFVLTGAATAVALLGGFKVVGNASVVFTGILALTIPASAGIAWLLWRTHRARASEVATWTAVPGELRIDIADGRRPDRAVRGRAHPAPRLHEVAAVAHDGRPMLVARTRGGRTIARLDANLARGEAELLAQRMTLLIWEGRSAPT